MSIRSEISKRAWKIRKWLGGKGRCAYCEKHIFVKPVVYKGRQYHKTCLGFFRIGLTLKQSGLENPSTLPQVRATTSQSYVQAKKRPDGKWRLFFRGTRNEVFPGELFKSSADAIMAFKVAKARSAETEVNPRDYTTPWLASRVKERQTPEARKAKYHFVREKGLSSSWARKMMDWPSTKIFRRFGEAVPPIAERKTMGIYPNPYYWQAINLRTDEIVQSKFPYKRKKDAKKGAKRFVESHWSDPNSPFYGESKIEVRDQEFVRGRWISNPRPPAGWWNSMLPRLRAQYPKFSPERLSSVAAGIWYGYPERTRSELMKKYDNPERLIHFIRHKPDIRLDRPWVLYLAEPVKGREKPRWRIQDWYKTREDAEIAWKDEEFRWKIANEGYDNPLPEEQFFTPKHKKALSLIMKQGWANLRGDPVPKTSMRLNPIGCCPACSVAISNPAGRQHGKCSGCGAKIKVRR